MSAPSTRDTVLSEAARLFAERGYGGATVADIGAACGISGPALYKHFPSKYAVLSSLLVVISEHLAEAGKSVVATAQGPRDALERLVAFHVDFAIAEPDVIRVQDRDLETLEPSDRRQVRQLQKRYAELWIATLRELEPALAESTARVRVHATFGLLNSTPYIATSREGTRRELVTMALRALTSG
jgi:AcrR family transcriptional regulator